MGKILEKVNKNDSPLNDYFKNAEDSNQRLSFDTSSEEDLETTNTSQNNMRNLVANVPPNNHLSPAMRHNYSRQSSRNSSRSPIPSPLSKPGNSQPRTLRLSGASPGVVARPNAASSEVQGLRHRPHTPQSPDSNTPEKIQRFQSRLRRFRPAGANTSLNMD